MEFNPKELEFCEGACEVPNVCLDCLVQNLDQRQEGQLLREKVGVRYGNWAWDDHQRMIQYIPDCDPVFHGIYQARNIALPMIERGHFSRAEAKLLMIAHTLHDAHEGIWGDIPKPLKTRQNDEQELELNVEIVSSLINEPVDSEFMRDYRRVVGDLDGETHLGRAFSAGEQLGYFLTGIRAWSLRNHNALTEEERGKCEDMGRVVALSCVEKLAALEEFPLCGDLLEQHAWALREMSL